MLILVVEAYGKVPAAVQPGGGGGVCVLLLMLCVRVVVDWSLNDTVWTGWTSWVGRYVHGVHAVGGFLYLW